MSSNIVVSFISPRLCRGFYSLTAQFNPRQSRGLTSEIAAVYYAVIPSRVFTRCSMFVSTSKSLGWGESKAGRNGMGTSSIR